MIIPFKRPLPWLSTRYFPAAHLWLYCSWTSRWICCRIQWSPSSWCRWVIVVLSILQKQLSESSKLQMNHC